MAQMIRAEATRRIAVNRAVLDLVELLESRVPNEGERAEAHWIGQQLRGRQLWLENQPALVTTDCLAV